MRLPKRTRRAAICLVAVLSALDPLAATPSDAQIRLGPESGGSYSLKVMTWRDIPFRTVVRQRYDFSCGSAALATLLTYHFRRPMDERASFASMWATGDQAAIRKQGFSLLDMKTYLKTIGFHAEGYRLTIDQLREFRRPMIVLLDLRGFKHFVVLKGMRGNRVLAGDPMLGLTSYPTTEFSKYWNGIVLAVLANPSGVRPTYDLDSDWGPWSRAPMKGEAGVKTAIGDLTGNLPPTYQISRQLLLDVRVGTVN